MSLGQDPMASASSLAGSTWMLRATGPAPTWRAPSVDIAPGGSEPDRLERGLRGPEGGCPTTARALALALQAKALGPGPFSAVCQALPLSNPLEVVAGTEAQRSASPHLLPEGTLRATVPPPAPSPLGDLQEPLAGSDLTPAGLEAFERLSQGSRGFLPEGDWESQPTRGGWAAILAPDGPPTSHALNSVVIPLAGLARPRLEWTADFFLSDGGADNRMAVEVRGADGTWTGHRFEVDDGFQEFRVIDLSSYAGQKIQVRFRAENKVPSPPPVYEDDYYYRVRDVRLTGLDASGQAVRRDDLGSDFRGHLLTLATSPAVEAEERSALLVHLAGLPAEQAQERLEALAASVSSLPPTEAAQAVRQELESHLVGARREAPPPAGSIETDTEFVTIGGILIPRRH